MPERTLPAESVRAQKKTPAELERGGRDRLLTAAGDLVARHIGRGPRPVDDPPTAAGAAVLGVAGNSVLGGGLSRTTIETKAAALWTAAKNLPDLPEAVRKAAAKVQPKTVWDTKPGGTVLAVAALHDRRTGGNAVERLCAAALATSPDRAFDTVRQAVESGPDSPASAAVRTARYSRRARPSDSRGPAGRFRYSVLAASAAGSCDGAADTRSAPRPGTAAASMPAAAAMPTATPGPCPNTAAARPGRTSARSPSYLPEPQSPRPP